ncbi:MAG: hypothetical protein ACRDWD_15285 [Acidimicrobiia bacterium]
MRQGATIATLLVAVGLVVAADATAAVAGLPCAAGPGNGDGRVRLDGQPFIGKNVFNCDGTDQRAEILNMEPGGKAKFLFRYLNDSDTKRDIHLDVVALEDNGGGKLIVRPRQQQPEGGGGGHTYKDVKQGESTPAMVAKVKFRQDAQPGDTLNVGVYGALLPNGRPTADTPFLLAAIPP